MVLYIDPIVQPDKYLMMVIIDCLSKHEKLTWNRDMSLPFQFAITQLIRTQVSETKQKQLFPKSLCN